MDTNRDLRKTSIKTTGTRMPSWYDDRHRGTWDRMKEAMRRDWEQTKSDFGADTARDLNQGVTDTIKQAAGKEPLPLPSQKTHPDQSWNDVEPAIRYGYASRSQYADHVNWDAKLEQKLENEWNTLDTGHRWQDVKPSVRRGWEAVRPKS